MEILRLYISMQVFGHGQPFKPCKTSIKGHCVHVYLKLLSIGATRVHFKRNLNIIQKVLIEMFEHKQTVSALD